jgi:16S rRNA G1207 methylase RsmC
MQNIYVYEWVKQRSEVKMLLILLLLLLQISNCIVVVAKALNR